MAGVPLGSPEDRIQELTDRLKKFTDFALAHEAFEGKLLNDGGSWFDEMLDCFPDEFNEVQRLRNEAMGFDRKEGRDAGRTQTAGRDADHPGEHGRGMGDVAPVAAG